jgi:hypothetical protein
MSYDLHGGLHDLSGDPITERDLPLRAILGRLHRTRRIRTAGYSAVGVATAVVVAVAVVASGTGRDPSPVPPVETPGPDDESPSEWVPTFPPTPLSTPTPTPDAVPSAACGTTVDLFTPLLDGAQEYSLALTNRSLDYGPQVSDDPGAPFRLTVGIVSLPGARDIESARILRVLAGHGEDSAWTVDGVPARAPRQVSGPSSPFPESFPVAADVTLVGCDGAPLDGDTYRIAATVEITTEDGSVVVVTEPFWAYIGDEPTGEPERYPPAQQSGEQAWVRSTARIALAGLPTCGQAYDRRAVSGAGLTLSSPPAFEGRRIMARVTLTHAGLDVADGLFVGPFLTVTQGGVVVGQTQDLPYTAWALKAWDSGDSVRINTGLLDSACEPMDGALPPGDYEVWAMVTLWTEPDVAGTPQFFYGGPWSVTVPDETVPPATEPPAIEPPATQPPVTQPPATPDPTATQPPAPATPATPSTTGPPAAP